MNSTRPGLVAGVAVAMLAGCGASDCERAKIAAYGLLPGLGVAFEAVQCDVVTATTSTPPTAPPMPATPPTTPPSTPTAYTLHYTQGGWMLAGAVEPTLSGFDFAAAFNFAAKAAVPGVMTGGALLINAAPTPTWTPSRMVLRWAWQVPTAWAPESSFCWSVGQGHDLDDVVDAVTGKTVCVQRTMQATVTVDGVAVAGSQAVHGEPDTYMSSGSGDITPSSSLGIVIEATGRVNVPGPPPLDIYVEVQP